jgi:NADPH2:quinone reductase
MHAVVYERHGGPEVLEYREVPDPTPEDRQVRVDVEAVGINFRDVYEREGREYVSTPPAIAGVEGAGTITATRKRVPLIGVTASSR